MVGKPLQQAVAVVVAEVRKITNRPCPDIERPVLGGFRRLICGGIQSVWDRNHFPDGNVVKQVLASFEQQLRSDKFRLQDRKQSSLVRDGRSRKIDFVTDKGEQGDIAARQRLDVWLQIDRRVAIGGMKQHDSVDFTQQARKLRLGVGGYDVERNDVELRRSSECVEPIVKIR